MKNTLLAILLLSPLSVMAQQDQSILFEVGIGFGTATSKISNTCAKRSSDRPLFAAVRYRYNDVELHGSTWKGAGCGRDAIALGVGYVFDTQGDGLDGRDDVYASWTPGVSYVWQDDSTTSRLENNVNMFNRVALGVSDENGIIEVAVNRYGRILKNYDTTGENFVGVGVGYQDLVDNLPTGPTPETATTTVSPTPTVTEPAKEPATGGNGNGDGTGDGDKGGNGNDEPVIDPPVIDPPVIDPPVYAPPGNGKNPGNKNDDKDGVIDGNAGGGNDPDEGDTGGDELGKIGKGNASDKGNAAAGDHPSDKAR